ncbi:MAG: hypothetical protein HYU44_03405 [Betaproteobacteria bacterium]|nr:hypothetical protein [Betaproteobacteria bacterium]MBI2291067.1 hypothetical protein [Betaproteobacteria bacterium]MBI3053701.1 hypothetical protein [Betaproteobacteria bacterium]
MAIRLSVDVATRISPELSETIEELMNDPDREVSPQTLDEVRAALIGRSSAETRETEFLHLQDEASLLVELDRLIEEYGKEAPAIDFVAVKASEGLSRIIQAAMDDARFPRAPMLGAIREAMVGGLTARLIGEGTIDEDDEGVLLGEIDEMIRRYGEETLAETLVRFE